MRNEGIDSRPRYKLYQQQKISWWREHVPYPVFSNTIAYKNELLRIALQNIWFGLIVKATDIGSVFGGGNIWFGPSVRRNKRLVPG